MIQAIKLNTSETSLKGKYSVVDTDIVIIHCDATNGAFTVYLPDSGDNRFIMFLFIKTDSSSNVVTIATVNNQTLNGHQYFSSNSLLEKQYVGKWYLPNSDKTGWLKITEV